MPQYVFRGKVILDDTEKHLAARKIGDILCGIGFFGIIACAMAGLIVMVLAEGFPMLLVFWGMVTLLCAFFLIIGMTLNAILDSQEPDPFW